MPKSESSMCSFLILLIWRGHFPHCLLSTFRGWVHPIKPDLSITEHDVAFGKPGNVRFMSDQHDSNAVVVQLLKKSHDLDARPAVQVARGLVGQDKTGIVDQGPRDRHPLLLAS